MSVRRPAPSETVQKLAELSCRQVSPEALRTPGKQLDEVRATLCAAHPLKVYVLGTLAVTDHKNLESAEPVAWRFLILRGKRTVASTEITLEESEGGARWTRTSYDPRQRRQLQSIERILSDPVIRRGDYEVRFLRLPGLDLKMLIWFHNADSSKDRIVQIGTSHFLRAGWPYSVEKLLSRLLPQAQRRRKPSAATRSPADSLVDINPASGDRTASHGGGA